MFFLARTPIGWWLIVLTTGMCLACAAGLYLLRFEPGVSKKLYENPAGKVVIDAICAMTGAQSPQGVAQAAARSASVTAEEATDEVATYSVLKTASDFQFAAHRIKQWVLGHDAVVDTVMEDLKRAVMVRVKRPDSGGAALAAYLLAGPPGIGKRLLSTHVGRQLYPEGGLTVLDGREYTDVSAGIVDLFGSANSEGRLVASVRRQALHTIVIESFESAHPSVLEHLASVLQGGVYHDSVSGVPVSFEHCVVFLLSTKIARFLDPDQGTRLGSAQWQTEANELILAQTRVPAPLLESVHQVVPMCALDRETSALVIAQLMAEQCQRHRVELAWIDPEVLVEEVAMITPARGFDGVQSRVKARLREDLARAVEISMPRLSIRARKHAVSEVASHTKPD